MEIIKSVLSSLFCFLIIYLIGSFISASFYINEWNNVLRGMIGCLGLVAIILSFFITMEYLESIKK